MRGALALFAASCLAACTSIPQGRSAVDSVRIIGNEHVDDNDIEDKIATAATPKFLGLFRGIVFDYEVYDRNVLAYDLARVERYYRSRGYYDARARAGRVFPAGSKHVRIEIVVDEGQPVIVRDVIVDGVLSIEEARDVRKAINRHQREGKLLDEEKLEATEKAVRVAMENQGHAKVNVDVTSEVDLPSHAALVRVAIDPHEKCTVAEVRIEGIGTLPEHAVRRQLDLRYGQPYTRKALDRAKQRLLDLGVVSSIEIEPVLDDPRAGVVPIRVRLEPAKLRDLRLGGGFELDALKFDLHLHARWEDRNFLGDLRRFNADFVPGAVLYPTRLTDFRAPNRVLPEGRLKVELRQPGFLEALTTGFVRVEPAIYPVLIRSTYVPEEPVLGYRELRTTAGVERLFGPLDVTLSYSLQVENPFTYFGDLDPSLQTMVISFVEAMTSLDFRDRAVHPHEGVYLANDLQVAGLGGQAHDVRVQPEARAYLPIGRRITIAARTSVGFLFPFDYQVGTDARDVQLVFFRGFFSGGPSQNRGYPLRGIGPYGDVSFYNPIVNPCVGLEDKSKCFVPLGGLSLWEASLEGRIKIAGPVEGVLFCDASDVSAQLALHLDRPHLSCGVGGRYDTPVGPLRVDVAYRIPGAQVASGTAEPVPELAPGVPIAIQVGLGEAF